MALLNALVLDSGMTSPEATAFSEHRLVETAKLDMPKEAYPQGVHSLHCQAAAPVGSWCFGKHEGLGTEMSTTAAANTALCQKLHHMKMMVYPEMVNVECTAPEDYNYL